MAVVVHQISIEKASGCNLISVTEWTKLTSADRVELIMKRKVQFLDEDGEIIATKVALECIKVLAA